MLDTTISFTCNLCGAQNHVSPQAFDREAPTCGTCGSNVRFRAIVDALSTRLFGDSLIITDFPRGTLVGVGMSDAPQYANRLAEVMNYQNTFYHTTPKLDITNLAESHIGRYDFVITSDVFEHVTPPVQRAFDSLFALLKPGGSVVFSVPYSLDADTAEHYPNLHDWRVTEQAGHYTLENRTIDGRLERFDNLIFHGGPGTTLEMRLFSRGALERHFAAAGFVDLRIHSEPNLQFGIAWPHPWSIVMSAVRPRAARQQAVSVA